MEDVSIYHNDTYYMQKALELARMAEHQDEIPVGAVVVDAKGLILGFGYNQVEKEKTQTAHAEMCAINDATQKRGDWRLNGCTLYVTLEPCRMCMALIQLSRISHVVYAASSPRFGYQLDNTALSPVYKEDVVIREGICADLARDMLQRFFQKQRKRKG